MRAAEGHYFPTPHHHRKREATRWDHNFSPSLVSEKTSAIFTMGEVKMLFKKESHHHNGNLPKIFS